MKAIVIEQAGNPDVLRIKDVPRPQSQPGWVSIEVKAFGLNRSEMFTRQGHSPNVKFPRILGIECVGIVVEAPETNFQPGQKVAAFMGGMGRDFDGSYAEYTCVPQKCVFPIESELEWSILGAIPEMFQTTWGALTKGLEVKAGQTLLIRGGTSSIGLAATHLAKAIGLTVISTTRNSAKVETLKANGVDRVIIDNGTIADSVRNIFPQGVDRVLELVGTVALIDSLKTVTPGGILCIAGCLGNEWILKEFFPMAAIPKTVRLTVYGGGSDDLSAVDLQNFIDGVAAGRNKVIIDRVFHFDEIVEAHSYMESNQATGKLVILVDEHHTQK
ncbi:NADPH:quinone reductase [Oscillatoriales cyanobacterium USR001]|nr:NADPH:quinone reductase [Oscillatoriales cyanobacterium USR001]